MHVLMQGRFGVFSASGGDRIQIENTAEELRKLGVEVDLADDYIHNFEKYDLVHIFQLDWTPETYFYIKQAKDASKKIVFSPIHHNIDEVKKFDDVCVYDYRRVSKLLFKDQHARDTFKNVYRSLFNIKKAGPTLFSVFKGLKNMHTDSLRFSDKILVQTKLEAQDLISTYGVNIDWEIIPNGVGDIFFDIDSLKNPLGIDNYLFCIGRIEPRKNQLSVIEAVKKIQTQLPNDFKLVFLGNPNPLNHLEFTSRFKKHLKENDWIIHIPGVPYKEVPSYFKYAKVTISASWFETTGLTLLESLFCGTNAVASSPRAKEILGDLISYCDPADINSISQAILKEYKRERPVLPKEMKHEYTWKNAAEKTHKVYENLLNTN